MRIGVGQALHHVPRGVAGAVIDQDDFEIVARHHPCRSFSPAVKFGKTALLVEAGRDDRQVRCMALTVGHGPLVGGDCIQWPTSWLTVDAFKEDAVTHRAGSACLSAVPRKSKTNRRGYGILKITRSYCSVR